MNQYEIKINGEDLSWWNQRNNIFVDSNEYVIIDDGLISGSAEYVFRGLDEWINPSGMALDPYRYPALPQNEDLWRCEGCGAVHRVKDTLECTKCGLFITEESRFVLK